MRQFLMTTALCLLAVPAFAQTLGLPFELVTQENMAGFAK